MVIHLRAMKRHPPYGITRTLLSALSPAKQAGTRLIFPARMEGWVDLGGLPVRTQSHIHRTHDLLILSATYKPVCQQAALRYNTMSSQAPISQ